ncbi:cell division protein FtsQ/DivIB [Enterococcus dongliensis]|uniref:cell division protein FtsQ/DivIB n=1 Tax=Enterococcus dongliensis TaxID=2559925 RepID=UPI00288E2B82|nr:cell division protein FtsQ/DivIB [Enterococcus dongliensis]MDT2613711.1 cell division protein FtsQ/DivIB [Enterococcus dongliensis]MDT2674244.1 cell division protein FtsQ/DivIB [Enterococcus dongliensis]
MRIISREEFPKESKEQEEQPKQDHLTPWQLANLEYLKQKALENNESEVPLENSEQSDETSNTSEPADEKLEEPEETVSEPLEEDLEEVEETAKGPKNGSFLERLPNIKHERNRRLVRRASILIGLFSIPALLLLYYISPLAKLSGVSVEGNERISAETIEKELGFAVGDNLWQQYFDRKDKVKTLKKQELQIKDAEVHIEGFNHFNVQIKEYPEIAYLESDGKYSPIISNGKIIPIEVEKSEGDLPILESFTGPKRILKVLQGYKKLSEEVKQGISQIKYAPTNENKELLEVFMNDGNKVLVTINDFGKKMNYYPQIAKDMADKQIKGVVDMEAGIYSYPYEEDTTAENPTQNSVDQSETPIVND